MRKKSKAIFWLVYFDKRLTRKQGRRLSKNHALEKLTLEQLADASRALGYETELDYSAKFPAHWWDRKGRILVDIQGQNKNKVFKKIAAQLRKTQ